MNPKEFEANVKGILKSNNIKKSIGTIVGIVLDNFQKTTFFKKRNKANDDFRKELLTILKSIDSKLDKKEVDKEEE